MELKRNVYVDKIYKFLREEHLLFFFETNSNEESSEISYKYLKMKTANEQLNKLVEDVFKTKITDKSPFKLSVLDYIYLKLLQDNKNLSKLNGKNMMMKVYKLLFHQPEEGSHYNSEIIKELILKLNENFPKLNYKLLSKDEIIEEIELTNDTLVNFINSYFILYSYFKFIELMTLMEYCKLVNSDLTLLVLYCEVLIGFSNISKDNLIHTILNYFKNDPNSDPHLLVLLIILGFNYDNHNLDIFNQKDYHFKFVAHKHFLSNYFKDLVHVYDFDEFSLIHTIIYAFSMKNFTKELMIRNDLTELTSSTYLFLYMLNMFKTQFHLKINGTTNYITSSEYKTSHFIVDNILNCYFLLNECFYTLCDSQITEEGQSIYESKISRLQQGCFNIEVNLDYSRFLFVKLLFEKTAEYRNCIIYYLTVISKVVKSQKVYNLSFLFEVGKSNKRHFSSELKFLSEMTVLNIFVDLYTILSHEGEICSNLNDLFDSFKYSSCSKALKPRLLKINFSTISFEKIIDKIGEKVIVSDKLFSLNFLVTEFNICINSDNGFEIFEILISELYSRINKDEILISIKLYEENPVYLKINKLKETVKLSFPSCNEITSSLGQLIFYLFSLIYNVLGLNIVELDAKLGEHFAFEEDLSFFKSFQKISINCHNSRDNSNLLYRILKENQDTFFKELELIYFPIYDFNLLLNNLRKIRCGKLTLNIVLSQNEKDDLSILNNLIKSLFTLDIDILNLSFMLKCMESFIEMRSIMIKSFDKKKFVHCTFFLDEYNVESYQNLDNFKKWDMEKINRFSLDPKDFLTKTIIRMKDPFYNFLYTVNTKKFRVLRRGPVLKTVHDCLCKKVYLLGELWKINKQLIK
jgi:hypothetical protein